MPYSLEDINKILSARGLPTLEVYDEGFIDDDGNLQTFLPDNVLVVIGKRPSGQRIGEFAMTPTLHRQLNGQAAPGFFSFIEVNGGANTGSVSMAALGAGKNPKIEITGGVYGGTILFYPRSIVVMKVD